MPLPQPTWPLAWSVAFMSPPTAKNTTGTYTVTKTAESIVLADGTRDHLCSHVHNDTACTQLTVGGFRYLDFPQIDDCCKCCSYSSGSYLCGGPLGPEWLNNATGNLVYLGVHQGPWGRCHKWNAHGLIPKGKTKGDDNFYYQYVDSGIPCEIDGYNWLWNRQQRDDDQYVFNPHTYQTQVDPSVFAVPKRCTSAPYCGAGVCATGPEA